MAASSAVAKTGDGGDESALRVLCMDCEQSFTIEQSTKYGKCWKCHECHSAYRFLREKDPEWGDKTKEQRRQSILANRGCGGRGAARKVVALHKDGPFAVRVHVFAARSHSSNHYLLYHLDFQ
jgi:hypothetical protein